MEAELIEVWKECQAPGWDGYGALPVEPKTYHMACAFIKLLPLGFPRPSISAEPDGQITFEWYRCQRQTLSISIDPLGFIHFAGLFGDVKRFGTEPFTDNIPDCILRMAREICV